MAKVVVKRLPSARNGRPVAKSGSVGEKRVRDATGKVLTVRTLQAQSKTFGKDLTYVFTKNVAKARRENKEATGALDRAPAKA